jgi:hypothetical protein
MVLSLPLLLDGSILHEVDGFVQLCSLATGGVDIARVQARPGSGG